MSKPELRSQLAKNGLGRRANNKIRMETEDLVKDKRSNTALNCPLTDHIAGRNSILLWKSGKKKFGGKKKKKKKCSLITYTYQERKSGFLQICALILTSKNMLSHKGVCDKASLLVSSPMCYLLSKSQHSSIF